jgi:hypothetical protein
MLVGAVACIIAAIRSKRWLLLLAALALLAGAGIVMRTADR